VLQPWGGPPEGGTTVHVTGDGFQTLGAARCHFTPTHETTSACGATSSWSVPVTIMNATHAVCTSPPSRRCTATPEDEGRSSEVSASSTSSHMSAHPASFQSTFDAVSFCLSLNGHDCVGPPPAATRFFTYAVTGPLPWQAGVQSLEPVGGPMGGGTLLRLGGRGLVNLGGVRCVLTPLTSSEEAAVDGESAPPAAVIMPAKVVSTEEVRCVTPAMLVPLPHDWIDVSVSLLLNGDAHAPLHAAWHSPSPPPLDAVDASTFAHDGVTPADAPLRFTFYRPEAMPLISQISPSAGPVAGGTPLTLSGVGIGANLFGAGDGGVLCRFGAFGELRPPVQVHQLELEREAPPPTNATSPLPPRRRVRAAWVVCTSPRLPSAAIRACAVPGTCMSVSVSLSLNGGNPAATGFATAPTPFAYYIDASSDVGW